RVGRAGGGPAGGLGRSGGGVLDVGGVGVAGLRVADGDAVEADDEVLRLPGQRGELLADDGDDGIEVGGVVVVGRHDAQGGHAPLAHQRLEQGIRGGGGGGGRVLRV